MALCIRVSCDQRNHRHSPGDKDTDRSVHLSFAQSSDRQPLKSPVKSRSDLRSPSRSPWVHLHSATFVPMVGRTDNDGASPVESGTVERAVRALQKYVAKKEAESAQMSLVDDDQFYILVLNLFSAPSKAKTSPKRM